MPEALNRCGIAQWGDGSETDVFRSGSTICVHLPQALLVRMNARENCSTTVALLLLANPTDEQPPK
jgi:hypothetical protein